MICPLFKAANIAGSNHYEWNSTHLNCDTTDCALWDNKAKQCGLISKSEVFANVQVAR
jgi:hypothetical protein